MYCISKTVETLHQERERERVIVFKSTVNNISVISWRSVLLVEETGIPRENYRPAASFNIHN